MYVYVLPAFQPPRPKIGTASDCERILVVFLGRCPWPCLLQLHYFARFLVSPYLVPVQHVSRLSVIIIIIIIITPYGTV